MDESNVRSSNLKDDGTHRSKSGSKERSTSFQMPQKSDLESNMQSNQQVGIQEQESMIQSSSVKLGQETVPNNDT